MGWVHELAPSAGVHTPNCISLVPVLLTCVGGDRHHLHKKATWQCPLPGEGWAR
jgi:hypothetical protein